MMTSGSLQFELPHKALIAIFRVAVFWLMSWSVPSHGEQILPISHNGNIPADYLSFWIDTSGEPTPNEAPLQGQLDNIDWQKVDSAPVTLGFMAEPVWFRLRLNNNSERFQERLLEIQYPLLDDIRIFIYADDRLIDSAVFGDNHPFAQREIEYPTFLKHLHVDSGETLDIVLRVATTSSMQVPLSLWHGGSLLHSASIDNLMNGVYYGTLLVIFIYNLFAFAKGGERKYLYYCLYILNLGLFFACMNGIAYQYLWPDSGGLTKPMIAFSLGSTILFSTLFTRDFLGLAASRPRLNLLLVMLGIVGATFMAAGMLVPYQLLARPMVLCSIVTVAILLGTGFVRWKDGHPAGMLFCLAWVILTVGIIIMALSKIGWIARSPVTEYTAQLGSMLDLILLSLALIQQLDRERKANSSAQKSALEFERQASMARQQALLVQQQAAYELEERVRQRTRELQIANQKLSALSTTDSLTGLKNRRFFNERLLAEFNRSKRDGTPYHRYHH